MTFGIDVFSLEYCNFHRWEGFSLEPRAFLTFRFLGGLLGGSRHHFGALLDASGGPLGALRAPWEFRGDPWGPLWAAFVGPWSALGTIWVHFGGIFRDIVLQYVS